MWEYISSKVNPMEITERSKARKFTGQRTKRRTNRIGKTRNDSGEQSGFEDMGTRKSPECHLVEEHLLMLYISFFYPKEINQVYVVKYFEPKF